MNYYQPRELRNKETGKGTGLYHYTCMNDDRIWAVGYCRENCPGHATPDEAREHYRQYELDHARYNGAITDMQVPCEVCKAWTSQCAVVNHHSIFLCYEHLNRETLEQIYQPGDAISSW